MAREMYKHRPLSSETEIRLIKLHPARNRSAEIGCSLRHVSLDDIDSHPYEALSYVWGSRTRDVDIVCEGQTTKVTENCVSALRRLRWKVRSRTLWIDAIAINQDDKLECGHQVKMMGAIYSSAKKVLIWTGDQWEAPLPIVALTKCLPALYWMKPLLSMVPMPRLSGYVLDWGFLCELLVHVLSDVVQALKTSDWPNRLWTLQEMLLAKRFELIHGRCKIPSKLLTDERFNASWEDHFDTEDGWRNRRIGQMDPISHRDEPVHLLQHACRMEAMDPRDRVFALYSVLQRFGLNVPTPDYRKSKDEVYTEATKAFITHRSNLHFNLTMKPRVPGSSNLPSWVPDLESQDAFDLNMTHWSGDPYAWEYKAAVGWCNKDVVSLQPDDIDLRLSGYGLGTICTVEDCPPDTFVEPQTKADGERLESWFEGITQGIPRRPYDPLSKLPNIIDATFSLLLGFFSTWDLFLDPLNPDDKSLSRKRGSRISFGFLRRYFSDGKVTDRELATSKIFEVTKDLEDKGDTIEAFRKWVQEALSLKLKHAQGHDKFFQLDSGLFGWGRPPARAGDVVAIVAGFKMPIVLRPTEGGRWHFLGAAYVPGVMYGEWWPEDSNEDSEAREQFVLR